MSMFRERDAARRRHQADVGAVRHERKKLKEAGEYVPGIAHYDDIQAAARARSGFADNATAAAGGAAGSIDHALRSAGAIDRNSSLRALGVNDANLQGRLSLFDDMKKAGAGAGSDEFRNRAEGLGIDSEGFGRGLNRLGQGGSLTADASNRPQVDIGATEVTQEMRDQAKSDPAGMETLDLEAAAAESSAPSLVAESAQPSKEPYRDADGKTDRMRGVEEMYEAPKEDNLSTDAIKSRLDEIKERYAVGEANPKYIAAREWADKLIEQSENWGSASEGRGGKELWDLQDETFKHLPDDHPLKVQIMKRRNSQNL